MRVVTSSNESFITREVRFGLLPKLVYVCIFRDSHGKMHALQIKEIHEIIDE